MILGSVGAYVIYFGILGGSFGGPEGLVATDSRPVYNVPRGSRNLLRRVRDLLERAVVLRALELSGPSW